MNSLKNLYESLRDESNEIEVAAATIKKALVPLSRMVDFVSPT